VPESFLLVFRTHRIFTFKHGRRLQIACNSRPCESVAAGYTGSSSI
jgi:hypothetical protein